MLYNAGPIAFLEPSQENLFYLLGAEYNSEEKVTVVVTCIGAKTRKQIKIERDFPIVKNWLIS